MNNLLAVSQTCDVLGHESDTLTITHHTLISCNFCDIVKLCHLQYMEQMLSNSEYLEFFVEGGRTRSGKPLAPKDGLLSVIVDAVTSGIFCCFLAVIII